MRFDAKGRNAHFIARQTSRSRTEKRVKHPKFAAITFGQQPFYPLRRKACAVAKPPVNRQTHVVEKIGRVADHTKIWVNFLGFDIFVEQIEHSLRVVLAQAQKNAIIFFRLWVF